MGEKHTGGKITIKCSEHCYIIGIASITPYVDYSQGNEWDVNLKTMDDFHKPALDSIGFQDLITEQLAWWDTRINDNGTITKKSAGKQPAWANYMTDVNKVYGNFAKDTDQMFMIMNRNYEHEVTFNETTGAQGVKIKDLTTYIDPKKFNHIFAYTRRDAQNFWVQIGINAHVRRKMSAKVIPNL